MEARSSKEKEEGEKTMMKQTTKSLPKLMELPVGVLAKIFNFLQNHDIRCGVSMACKIFQKICQDQSLVPVKDLCIKGHDYWSEGEQLYGLRNIGAVCDTINQNHLDLTKLKITGLNYESKYRLVSTALQVCPKLIHLELIDINLATAQFSAADYGYEYFKKTFDSIFKFGQKLEKINLTIFSTNYFNGISCLNLKSLTLETLELPDYYADHFMRISESEGLECLVEECKELKNLKFTKLWFYDLETKEDVENMFPNCNVEFKNCKFGPNWDEHDSNSESNNDSDENDDVFDNFDGGEIEFMFTQNYGEELNKLGYLI